MAEIEYSEPITDSLKVKFGLNYNTEFKSDDRNTYDFNSGSQAYSDLNPELTNHLTSETKIFRPQTVFSLKKKKYDINATVGPSIVQFDNNSLEFN